MRFTERSRDGRLFWLVLLICSLLSVLDFVWWSGPLAAEASHIERLPGERYTWYLCQSSPCVAGVNVSNPVLVARANTLSACYIRAKTGPVGADLQIDILRNANTTVLAAPLSIADGGTAGSTASFSAAATLQAGGHFLTVSILQIGSGVAGQDVSVVCVGN